MNSLVNPPDKVQRWKALVTTVEGGGSGAKNSDDRSGAWRKLFEMVQLPCYPRRQQLCARPSPCEILRSSITIMHACK